MRIVADPTPPFENATHDMASFFSRWVGIEGKRCLCIGFDAKQLEEHVLVHSPASVKLLTLWAEHDDAVVPGFEVVVGDISRRTPFSDGSFDLVITFSLLEHVHELENAFLEIQRVLCSGGYFASLFGPAWTCHVGHHLYAQGGHRLFDFWQRGLPAHLHLTASRDEVVEWFLSQEATAEEAASVVNWFFDAPVINRIPFDEYMRLLPTHFQMVASEYIYAGIAPGRLVGLREAFPGLIDFSSYGGKFLARKYDSAY